MLSESTVAKVLKAALSRGGDFAEIYCESSTGTHVALEDNRLEDVITGQDAGVGVRLVRGGREVYGYSNDFSQSALLEVAHFLASAASGKPGRRSFSFKKKRGAAMQRVARKPARVPLREKVDYVERGNARARDFRDIRQATVSLRDNESDVLIANSDGLWASDHRTYLTYSVHVVAERRGTVETGYEPVGGTIGYELLGEERVEEVAAAAAERARMLLRAPKARGGTMSVVLSSSAGGTMIHEAVGHGLEADLAQEELSVYAGKIGQRIASPLITVIDDATLSAKRGSYRFDDEGTPGQRTVLVEEGILKRFMESRITSEKDGAKPTGNGRRESYEHLPIVRMSNTLIAPGHDDPQSIIASVDRGLLVTQMGGGQVNTVNGDFVFEVSEGFVIERGQVGHAVRGATLTGNGPKVLMEIDRVGSDLGYGIGTCGKEGQGVPVADAQPTLRIPRIVVGGH